MSLMWDEDDQGNQNVVTWQLLGTLEADQDELGDEGLKTLMRKSGMMLVVKRMRRVKWLLIGC